MPPLPLSPSSRQERGFSLIEVAIAVSILTICLVALIGLLPGGMSNFRKAMDTTTTAQIAQRILHDMEQAEFDQMVDIKNLPLDDKGQPKPHYSFLAPTVRAQQQSIARRYFDDQGNELVPADGKTLSTQQLQLAVYTVLVRIIPRAAIPAKKGPNSKILTGDVAQVTVQVARNPSNRTLPTVSGAPDDPGNPSRNLFAKTAGVTVFTYHSLIGKNQGK